MQLPDASVGDRIETMFVASLGRPASADERRRFELTVTQIAELQQVAATDVLKSQAVWKDVAHAVFNLNEFIYVP